MLEALVLKIPLPLIFMAVKLTNLTLSLHFYMTITWMTRVAKWYQIRKIKKHRLIFANIKIKIKIKIFYKY